MNVLIRNCCLVFCLLISDVVLSQENLIDQWADEIVGMELGPTTLGVPEDVLGALDKPGQTGDGFIALGGGWIEVDMGLGEEIEDGPGPDFVVHEAGNNEGVRVLGKNSLEEDWIEIAPAARRNEFDLMNSALTKARFIRIEDQGSTLDGADVLAVEAFYYPNDPWADEIIQFDLNPDFPNNPNQDPVAVIGPPNEQFVSLPRSTLIVRFTDNTVVDNEGNDLFISEVGGGGESARVSVSSDGNTFVELGIADNNSTTEFDLSSVGFSQPVVFVMLEGLDTGGSSPGFDADAIFALPNSIGAPPPPIDDPNDSRIVTVLDPQFEWIDTIALDGRPLYPDGFRPLALENGEVILAIASTEMPDSPFDQLVSHPKNADAFQVLRVEEAGIDRQILSMFFSALDEISLIIGPDEDMAVLNAKYYLVRIKTFAPASQVNRFQIY